MSEGALITATGLGCEYRSTRGLWRRPHGIVALQDVNLTLEPGEVLGVVGESGCGKSTLARILLGLQRPSSGAIYLKGKPLGRYTQRQLARLVQPVFQDPMASLNPAHRIESIVSLPLRVHGSGDSSSQRAEVLRVMDLCGLPARFCDRYPAELSGGQRQRVAIARALILKPEIVICDEPTSALDVSVQAQVLNLLLSLQRELKLAYVLISHNLAVIQCMSTRIMVMHGGRVVEAGATAQIFAEPQHPYTQLLLDSVLNIESIS